MDLFKPAGSSFDLGMRELSIYERSSIVISSLDSYFSSSGSPVFHGSSYEYLRRWKYFFARLSLDDSFEVIQGHFFPSQTLGINLAIRIINYEKLGNLKDPVEFSGFQNVFFDKVTELNTIIFFAREKLDEQIKEMSKNNNPPSKPLQAKEVRLWRNKNDASKDPNRPRWANENRSGIRKVFYLAERQNEMVKDAAQNLDLNFSEFSRACLLAGCKARGAELSEEEVELVNYVFGSSEP